MPLAHRWHPVECQRTISISGLLITTNGNQVSFTGIQLADFPNVAGRFLAAAVRD
jgi:hypothetical protein